MVRFADKLVGQKIVVVGGSSGIGFGAAEILLDAGSHVTIISSSPHKVEAAVTKLKAISPHVDGKVGNVRDEEGFTELLKSLAPLDHIVYSGVDMIIRGPLAEANFEEAKHLFGVKFWGSLVTGKALVKYDIVKPGGSLTLTSGHAGIDPAKGASIGGSLNGGIFTMTKGLANELRDKKIRVNCVVPGMVQTELWDKQGRSKEEQKTMFEKEAKKLSVGFVANAEQIAEAYLYCVRADYANGTLVLIDGGAGLH